MHALERAHLLQHLVRVQKVVEREDARAHPRLHHRLLVLVDRRLGLLDQGEHVAHAEDPRRHPLGVELLELVELLPDRDVLDRLAGDRSHRERGAAARVAVELRQDDAVEGDALLEGLRDVDGLLAGHRVEHEQDVRRLRRVAHPRELFHQVLVDVQPASGVEDHHVLAGRLRAPGCRTCTTSTGSLVSLR